MHIYKLNMKIYTKQNLKKYLDCDELSFLFFDVIIRSLIGFLFVFYCVFFENKFKDKIFMQYAIESINPISFFILIVCVFVCANIFRCIICNISPNKKNIKIIIMIFSLVCDDLKSISMFLFGVTIGECVFCKNFNVINLIFVFSFIISMHICSKELKKLQKN